MNIESICFTSEMTTYLHKIQLRYVRVFPSVPSSEYLGPKKLSMSRLPFSFWGLISSFERLAMLMSAKNPSSLTVSALRDFLSIYSVILVVKITVIRVYRCTRPFFFFVLGATVGSGMSSQSELLFESELIITVDDLLQDLFSVRNNFRDII